MNYPLISEYIEAIRYAEDNFDKLSNLQPVLDDNGNPIMSSGNFAVVFKMKDITTSRLFAVKCFIKEQEQRGEHYKMITEELNYTHSSYLLHVRYLERELFVNTTGSDEEEFPVLVMDWVEGKPLDAYIRQHINDTYELQMLAYNFCKMGAWLLSQPFAHGDLKPDNILVQEDGTLVLVDYDGMYVPAMEGSEAFELGSPDFRHPLRDRKEFNEHIDDFSIASIALSLKSIALDSQLYHKYAAADRLLFSAADYRAIGQSSTLQAITKLSSDADLSLLLGMFLLALSKNSLGLASFRLLLLPEPQKLEIEVLSTEITDEERKNAVTDKFGATYTADGLKLIHAPLDVTEYIIKDGTKVIGDEAFGSCFSLTSISIPNGVTSIGESAFEYCSSLTSISIPESVTSIGEGVFNRCQNLHSIFLNSSKFYVQDNILYSKEGMVISCWSSSPSIILPQGVTRIGNRAFESCESLTSISIPESVTSIGEGAFGFCESLTSISIPESVTSIGEGAFIFCESLTSITIPNGVTSIGKSAFFDCKSLTSISISESVTSIGEGAFGDCKSLTSITIPESVTSIGEGAFIYCESLTSISIPESVTSIGECAFGDCKSLTSITIPESVTSIGGGVFRECQNLHSIVLNSSKFYVQDNILYSKEGMVISCWSSNPSIILPQGVTRIGNRAFEDCESLTSISIPESVTSIGERAFEYCKSLTSISIPESVMSIGEDAFSDCNSLKKITIPKGTKNKMLKLLGDWSKDKLIEI